MKDAREINLYIKRLVARHAVAQFLAFGCDRNHPDVRWFVQEYIATIKLR